MSDTSPPSVDLIDLVRFLVEIFAIVTFAIFGFTSFPLPWPGIAIGIGGPLLAILLWALFRSPKAVFAVDPFLKAIVEIVVFASAAIAWWLMGQPVVAVVFAVVATLSGVVSGRREFEV